MIVLIEIGTMNISISVNTNSLQEITVAYEFWPKARSGGSRPAPGFQRVVEEERQFLIYPPIFCFSRLLARSLSSNRLADGY